MIFYFFSSRLFENDFRRPLIETLVAKGHEAWHIRIGQQIVLTGPDYERREFNGLFGPVSLIRAHPCPFENSKNPARYLWTQPEPSYQPDHCF